jgi:hypothetical protein
MYEISEQLHIVSLTLFQYLPTANLAAGIKAGELHQGHYNANQYNYLEVSFRKCAFISPYLSYNTAGKCSSTSIHKTSALNWP